ncbi:TadE/TadG family type IV pilus assembly protein [Sinomonas sp. ASV322]|uniref:TadE/TadG family type IV pilus assembly protein n=1 Tax=Sinomonas sp. ASV322 TaxID=3041920 RepID=UPI0027DD604A|nr:TadE/TadG family type IV pilus assembly protein [Sinomonas sp. ASV322]MDQ4501879.1 TadE/TadG family type IV pilus assembly protein [Sinomonas sp. ASV322]
MFRKSTRKRERGAIAVEFALVVPLLLLIIVGIVEFSRIYNVQITLNQAAREGARAMAVHNDTATAQSQAITAAPGLSPALSASNVSVTPSSGSCGAGTEANATITYTYSTLTGFFGRSVTLTGKGAMQCGG